MHPILAVLLTGLLVTAAYSTGKDISTSHKYTAAAANTKVDDTANSQCPKPEPHQVYDAELPVKPGQNVVKVNGKFTYIENLYGKKCSGPLIKNGMCTGHHFCDGTKGQCQLDLFGKNQGECKLTEQGEKIKVVSNNTGVTNDGESPYAGIFRQAQQQQAPPPEVSQGTVNTQDTQAIKNVYGDASSQNGSQLVKQPPQQAPVVAPARNETFASQFAQNNNPQGATQAMAQQPLNANINPNTVKAAPPVNQPVTNTPTKLATAPASNPPSAQNTFNNPTTKLATAQTPTTNTAAGQTGNTSIGGNKVAAGSGTGNTGTGANAGSSGSARGTSGSTPGSNTPAPNAKPNLSTSIRNAFQGGLNATSIVNGVVNLVSNVISGGGRSSSQTIVQAVDNANTRTTNTRASERVTGQAQSNGNANAALNAQEPFANSASNQVSSFILPENAPAVLSADREIVDIFSIANQSFEFPEEFATDGLASSDTSAPSSVSVESILPADNTSTDPTPNGPAQNRGTTTSMIARELQQQYTLTAIDGSGNPLVAQNSFAPLPQPERSRSVVEVFHAISIPNILETISQGSVDFILRILKRDSPKNTVVYTEWEKDPVVPVQRGAAPVLPDGTYPAQTIVGGSVAQNTSGPRGDANAPVVSYEERLRETPAAVFTDSSPAHRAAEHVPMVNRAFVFDSLLPVPEVSIDIEQKVVAPTEPGPVGKFVRILFPWFFGEMR